MESISPTCGQKGGIAVGNVVIPAIVETIED
jgi:hypothetical protein